jgi:hypothetical protein
MFRLSHFLENWLTDSSEDVSLMCQPPFSLFPDTHFCWWWQLKNPMTSSGICEPMTHNASTIQAICIASNSHMVGCAAVSPEKCPEFHTTLNLYVSIILNRPPLWSTGQSSWLQNHRSRFNSLHYQTFWVVGLERGPFSLVSTTEELLGRNSNCFGLVNRD